MEQLKDPYIVITPQFHSPQGHRLIKNAYHFQLPPPFPPKRLFRPVFISQSVSVSISFPTSAVHIPQTFKKREKSRHGLGHFLGIAQCPALLCAPAFGAAPSRACGALFGATAQRLLRGRAAGGRGMPARTPRPGGEESRCENHRCHR